MLVRQKGVWPLLITTFMLMSCVDFEGIVEDVANAMVGDVAKAMVEDVAKAEVAIEKEFGGEVSFSWEMVNGEITYIHVDFLEPPRGKIAIGALTERLQKLVAENVKRPVPKVTVSF